MQSLALELIATATAVSAGLMSGWWLRGAPREASSDESEEARIARLVLERLRELADQVADRVGEHRTRVEEITSELLALEHYDPETVLAVIAELVQCNERMQVQLQTAEEKLALQAREIESQAVAARTDPLTGVANRRAFDDAMEACFRDYVDVRKPAVVMLLDVDHFKRLNDSHGHQVGDEVLRGLARALEQHLPRDCTVARYGGEEFAVVFPGREFAAVWQLAEAARREVGQLRFESDAGPLRVTISAGISHWLDEDRIGALVERADEALYASKRAGRDCGHFHDGVRVFPVAKMQAELAKTAAEAAAVPNPVDELDFAHTDFAAGISSREVFCDDVKRRLAEWKRGGAPISVLVVQVDDLERIGERYGADNARAIQRAAGLVIKSRMRDMDHVARFEEQMFSLLLPGARLSGATRVAERVRAAMARCQLPSRYACRTFTVSIGLAEGSDDEDVEGLLERTRHALQAAATQGRDCTYLHTGQRCELVGAGHISSDEL